VRSGKLRPPAGCAVLDVVLRPLRGGLPEGLPMRWRLRGYHSDWQLADSWTAQIPLPQAGGYELQAQFLHSDGVWNSGMGSWDLEIRPLYWQTRWFRWAVLCALGFVGVRLWLWRQRARQRARKALDEERTRIARDMHDDLGARLSQLAMLHEMFAHEYPQPVAAAGALQQLTGQARQAVETLDQVVWAINPRNDTLANVADYLTHCTTSYLYPLGIISHIEAPAEWPALTVRAQTRHQLILAFKEALQNIAKHAAARAATLRLELTGRELQVQLSDDGKGLPTELDGLEKDGLGNMQARLASIGGRAEFLPNPAGGTQVRFTISLS
jgi:signal transduction histidine kinase